MMQVSRANLIKLQLTGICLSFLILIPVGYQQSQSTLSLDPYWRYIGQMLSEYMQRTGHIPTSGVFPHHSFLINWVNEFTDDLAAPLFVHVYSSILGMESHVIQGLPILTLPLLLCQAAFAVRIVRRPHLFPIAILLAVSFRYLNMPIINSVHRVTIGWTLLFCILLYASVVRGRKSRNVLAGYLILVATYVMSYHTLVLASMLLFTTIYVLGELTSEKFFGTNQYLIAASIVVFYTGLVHSWLSTVALKFTTAIRTTEIGYGNILQLTFSSGGIEETVIGQYLPPSPLGAYSIIVIVASLTAVAMIGLGLLIRTYRLFQHKHWSSSDSLLLAVVVQIAANILILPLFPPSAATNPTEWGLFFLPMFALLFYSFMEEYLDIHIIKIILLVVIVVSPGFVATALGPTTDSEQLKYYSTDAVSMISWSADNINKGTITTDFNTASAYYALNGKSKTYLPLPPYTKDDRAEELVEQYYRPPGNSSAYNYYMISDKLSKQGMLHLGAIVTIPNSNINQQMDSHRNWSKIYTNKQNTLYTRNR